MSTMIEVRRIVVVRLSSVGDIIMATPVAHRLRQTYPQANICWLVDAGFESLLVNNTDIDQVVVFDSDGSHQGRKGIRRLAEQLAPVDLYIDLQHKLRTILLGHLLKPQSSRVMIKRKGLDLVRAIVGRDPILSAPHQCIRFLQTLSQDDSFPTQTKVPTPKLHAPQELVKQVKKQLQERFGNRPVIGIVLGSRHVTKSWPMQNITDLARLCEQNDMAIVFLGDKAEAIKAQSLLQGPMLNQCGGTLESLMSWIAACSVIVSPDSGPAHMAAALEIPVVTLFGCTSPARWAPIGSNAEVVRIGLPCSPCSNHGLNTCPVGTLECMLQLKAPRVYRAILRRLGNHQSF